MDVFRRAVVLTALLMIAVWSIALLGCSGSADPASTEPTPKSPPPSTSNGDPPAAAPALHVSPIDEKGLQEVIARHRGKVVLVDFWATWCVPCVKLLPHTVELQKEFADEGLVVVTVSLDDSEQAVDVREVLSAKGATGEQFISRYGGGTQSVEAFEIADGMVPFFQLYDRTGNLSQTFSQPIDPAAIDKAIEELLASP